jgi:hypothetical protein
MTPAPVRELRFRLPVSARVADVFSKEFDPNHKWGVDGTTLVVPVSPILVKRAYYRCQLTVVLQGTLSPPTVWTAPVVSCTEAMQNVACELGCVAVATPGDFFDIVPKESPQSNLTRISVETVPKELAATSNKLAYTFLHPNYVLALDVRLRHAVVSIPTKSGPPLKATNPPPLKATDPPPIKDTGNKEDVAPKLAIPKVGDADSLPFKLAGILTLEEPEPRRQAVLRNKDSGEYLRKFEGDTVMADLRVVSITDDAVVVADGTGKQYKFADRFEDKYNAATPKEKEPGSTKKGGPPAKKTGPAPKSRG